MKSRLTTGQPHPRHRSSPPILLPTEDARLPGQADAAAPFYAIWDQPPLGEKLARLDDCDQGFETPPTGRMSIELLHRVRRAHQTNDKNDRLHALHLLLLE